jgi:four helix bundle protein
VGRGYIMNYQDWLASVPSEITDDRLWQSEVYRLALFQGDLAWQDSRKLIQDRSLISLADQLYRASGSISANISEGFSRLSGRDQARFYEYALGSAREARDWYFKSRHVLGPAVTQHRLSLLAQIIRLLLKMIPKYRSQKIKEEGKLYEVEESQNNSDDLSNLLDNIPLPS